ncbi:nickel ABC transporter permease [Meiothermus taiwanensis]|jgi:peptide/nickel transport system permease protein|uniref:Glutathione transport system permease protein GsiC n=2 Tax=Meiothermus taiwanensis TaxID=172827 RepID=A0A399DWR9_9DEIN|nr:nickel ABC transporter permease [Meiothermus taiwanensis]AWR87497.1 binding-protein-dependent transport system inner membrane component [Meiothermus taiwanensis WR-220]KIQ56042.1 peptide ABC transporter permease [Meiothermus taiwanensis]KZK16178.1 peptide ABC transporter permease [Meiothermus taiwanensis]RIH75688.1 Glutathione transport system permease protein GsiC [Meiothermus taiwanensis]
MTTYILRRLLTVIPTLLGVLLAVFLMVRLAPGDPAQLLAGEFATPETLADIRQRFGLDQPWYTQLGLYTLNVFRGDLGESVRTRKPVTYELSQYFPNTLRLTLGAMLVALLIGIPAGIIAAIRPGTIFDLLAMLGALIGVSMPVFWFGLMAILIFSVQLGWFPVAGTGTLRHLILPAITLGIGTAAILARMTRSAMLEVLSQDYIRTARAKGVAGRVVIFKHALRNALIPVVTIAGLQFGGLLEGAVITETVFAWPGIGQLLVGSILARDYPVVQGAVLLIAVAFILINLIVDLLYGAIDPRIRYD